VDDDLLFSKNAPEMENVPQGLVGICRDSERRHTEAPMLNLQQTLALW